MGIGHVGARWTARIRGAATSAGREAAYLTSLGATRRERLGMVRFLACLHLARLMPFDTFGWTSTVRLHGLRFAFGVRTSEPYVVDEVFGQAQYDRDPAYVTRPGWTVVDLGANVGVFTVQAARRGARVLAVEPNPDCYSRLCTNVAANGCADRVTPLQLAVSDVVARGRLHVERGGTTGGTVTVEHDGALPVTTLDEAIAPHDVDQVDLLKVDIEGAEAGALRGAPTTLARTSRVIAEYHSRALFDTCVELLEASGLELDQSFVYYPAELSPDGEEVGLLYASRRRPAPAMA